MSLGHRGEEEKSKRVEGLLANAGASFAFTRGFGPYYHALRVLELGRKLRLTTNVPLMLTSVAGTATF